MANFGIDLLLESQKANIRSETDVLVIFMHWMLCKNNLRNVGVGDNKVHNPEDRPSELLPQGWNSDSTVYTLRYSLNDQIFILYGIVTDESLLINLLDTKSLKTASLVFDVKKAVKSKVGVTLDDFVNDSEAVIKRVNEEIVNPILKPSSEKETSEPKRDPLLIQPQRPILVQPHFGQPSFYDPLRDIGRGDLDPFGRGGGSLFRPPMPGINRPGPGGIGGLGPHGIPPGARFDPPNPMNRFDPNNDHFPPPGYDDMFM